MQLKSVLILLSLLSFTVSLAQNNVEYKDGYGRKSNESTILFFEDFETSPITSITNAGGSGELPEGGSPCGDASRGNTTDFNSANVDFNADENSTYFLGVNPESPCGGYYGAIVGSDILDLSGQTELYFKTRYFIGSQLNYGMTVLAVEFDNGTDKYAISSEFSVKDAWTELEVALPADMISSSVTMTIYINAGDGVALDDITIQNGPTPTCDPTSSEENTEACVEYEWNGEVYTTSGSYEAMFTNTAGCDSTAVLNLTILEATFSEQFREACDQYDWNGTTYNSSGIYEAILPNSVGCDSTATLNLTILEATFSTETISVCESYDWNGTTFTTSGNYEASFTNTVGCDSTARLSLTILEATTSETTIESCNTYEWNGTTYTASGNYEEILVNTVGCDSTATLSLSIKNSDEVSVSNSSCGSYVFGGLTLTSSGDYSETFTNTAGCDSLVNLSLTILDESSDECRVTAIDLFDESRISIGPNPTEDEVVIQFGSIQNRLQIELMDHAGKIIDRTNYLNADKVIQCLDGKPGVYFIRILLTGETQRTFRVVKNN